MTTWIILLVLLGLIAVSGYYMGAIRAGVSLIGLLLGLMLAFPLAPTVRPLIPLVGMANPVWGWILAPVLALILIEIVFLTASFFMHRPIALYFKYKTDDIQRHAWEKLSQRLGACIGLFMGGVYAVVVGLMIYIVGYLSVQVAADDKDSGLLKFVNRARVDMAATGFDKIVARFDFMPKEYYDVSDILGLLYQNPLLGSRIGSYPPLFAMREQPEFQETAKDEEFFKLWAEHPSVLAFINNPHFLAVINNAEVVQSLLKLDLKDFQTYLEKGVSPLYDPFKILGEWELDVDQVILGAKKANPDISARDLVGLKRFWLIAATNFTFTATSDKKVVLKGVRIDLSKIPKPPGGSARSVAAGSTPPPAAARTGGPVSTSARSIVGTAFSRRMSPEMAARYGSRYGTPAPAPAEPGEAPPEPPPIKLDPLLVQGTWDGEGTKYYIKFQDDKDQETSAALEGNEIVLAKFGQRLVFVRLD